MLPGGFSGGDEPDGSAKFIASFFRSPAVTEAVRDLLQHRDGLMLGICNGFQALIKLGLVPYGDIRPITAYDPTLTFNTIGRHQSMLVRTRVASTGSPWLSHCDAGSEYEIAISHGEGRFVAPQNVLDQLVANGQVATQYVDLEGEPTMDQRYNPNGSLLAIEASPARTAACSARWATRSAAASTCTRTSPAINISRSLRAAWTISRFDGRIEKNSFRHR